MPTKADAHLGGLFKRDWPHIFHVVFLLQIRKSMPFLSQGIFGHLGQKIWIMRWELKFLYLFPGSRSCIFLVPVSRCMYIYHVPFDNRTPIHFFIFFSSIMKCILKDLILAKKKLPVRKTNFERFAFSGKMRHRGGGRVHTLKKPKKTWRFGNCQRCCIQIE